MTRAPFGKRRVLMDEFDENEIWNHPERPWNTWARRVDAHPEYIKTTFREHGWERKAKKWIKAPCRLCYSKTNIDNLDKDRCCLKCQNPDREYYEKELRAFLERNPNFRSYIDRAL